MMATGIPGEVVRFLRCPHCGEHSKAANGSLGCSRDHTRGRSHDIARQGYVSLFPPDRRRRTPFGDLSKMVAVRAVPRRRSLRLALGGDHCHRY